jgi:multidrug efflux pump subunit AcrA (membrane-fusion protein)
MRTFHIGGAAQIADQSFVESNFEGTVRIRNRAVARNSDGDLMAVGRNNSVVIVGADGVERAVHRIIYGAKLKVDEGDQVKRGQRIAEFDPYTRPIITEVDGSSVRRPGRRSVHDRDDGRVHRHREARRDRLARFLATSTFAPRWSCTGRTARS